MSWIPEWTNSLRRTLELAGDADDQRLTPAAASIARARAR